MALKGGNFLAQDTNPQDIFISEEFTEEQVMIGKMVHDFCVQEIKKRNEKRKELTATDDLPEIIALLEKSAELGLCGVAIGEEHGGIDLDFNTGLIFSEKSQPDCRLPQPSEPRPQWISAYCILRKQRAKGQVFAGIAFKASVLLLD